MNRFVAVLLVLAVVVVSMPLQAHARSQEHEQFLLDLVGREALLERAMFVHEYSRGAEPGRSRPSAELYLRDSYIQRIIDEAVADIPEVMAMQLHFTDSQIVVDAKVRVLLDEAMNFHLDIPFTFAGRLAVVNGFRNRLQLDVITLKIWEGNLPADILLNVGLQLLTKSQEIERYVQLALDPDKNEGSEARVYIDVKLENIMDFNPQPITITHPETGETFEYMPAELPFSLPVMRIGYVSSRNGMLGMSLY